MFLNSIIEVRNIFMEHLGQISILDGSEAPKLSKAELRKVKEFQNKVKGLEYKRMSSKYSAKTGPPIKMLRPSKSEMRKVYDTISPLISVFVTLICCIFGTNYFLKNVIHDFVGRFAIGLAAGSVLGNVSSRCFCLHFTVTKNKQKQIKIRLKAIIEIYFILKRFQAEWDQENIVKF